jgi:hypothetical protein
MQRIFFLLLVLSFSTSANAQRYILKSSFADSAVPHEPDYSLSTSWASLPDKKDPADSIPNITFQNNQATADVDVFFIHPTTYTYKPKTKYKWNGDVNDEKLNHKTDYSTILYQASVFNGSCKIYAPRYRQAHISAFYSKNKADGKQALDLAYEDVKKSFQYYLDHFNIGRPFIIASHSQGTVHAVHLLKDFFREGNLKNRLVAAYLIGIPVNPDSIKFIAPCADSNQTGCICSWNTFAEGYYPKYYNMGYKYAVCTNPLSWNITSEYCSDTLNKGGVLRKFKKVVPHLCDAQVHEGLLWINKPNIPFGNLSPYKIYHIADYNLFYMNIRENVERRIHLFWK